MQPASSSPGQQRPMEGAGPSGNFVGTPPALGARARGPGSASPSPSLYSGTIAPSASRDGSPLSAAAGPRGPPVDFRTAGGASNRFVAGPVRLTPDSRASMYAPGAPGAASSGPVSSASSVVRAKPHVSSRYEYEGLDVPNFEDTPWEKPSLERAQEYAAELTFGGGKEPLCSSTLDLDKMGVSIGLYFRLMKYLSVLFFLMSVIAIPILWACRVGTRVSPQDIDPFKLNIWSLGNVNNGTTLVAKHLLSAGNTSKLISVCDALYSGLFLAFIFYWKYKVQAVSKSMKEDYLRLSDYAVMVKKLPPNATAKQVHDHFNGLYDLSKEDWIFNGFCCCFRQKLVRRLTQVNAAATPPPGPAALVRSLSDRLNAARYRHSDDSAHSVMLNAPVTDVSNTGDPMYANSWVAEVTLVHPHGHIIRKYQEQQDVMNEIRIAKATMKRFKTVGGRHPREYAKASARLEKLRKKMDRFETYHAAELTEDTCVAAFVVFNCEDSQRYCLEDYARSGSWWGRKTQETPLRFGPDKVPIMVTSAPEPSDLIWENLETTPRQRFWRQVGTYTVMILLLIASIIFLAVAQNEKSVFQASVPDLTVCNSDMPRGAYSNATFPSDAALFHDRDKDASCGSGLAYINYVSSSQGTLDPDRSWGCPNISGRVSPRCVSIHDNKPSIDTCHPSVYNATSNVTTELSPYLMSSITGCYCLSALEKYVSKYGFSFYSKMQAESTLCLSFAEEYLTAQALLVAAALLVVIINALLKWFLDWVTALERHDTHTGHQRSVSIKVFLAQFVNTGLIILIVNTRIPYKVPSGIGIFTGQFSSFNARWDAVVGTTIVITMLLNIVTPHVPLFMQRLCCCCCTRSAKGFDRFVTQWQVDKILRPEMFNPSVRVPIVLNTVFITMAYCTALPLLLPLAMLSLIVMYWVEKYALLRIYAKPPNMHEDFAYLILTLLPFALLIHLLFSVWMYGVQDGGLYSDPVDLLRPDWTARYNKYLLDFAPYDKLHLTPKLAREIVFPNAALFVIIVVVRLLYVFILRPLSNMVGQVLYITLCCFLCDRRRENAKHHNPRFTGPFNIRLDLGSNWQPSEQDYADGQRIAPDPARGEGAKVLMKLWMSDGSCNKVPHSAGQPMLTWQVMLENKFLVTYDMVAHPDYHEIRTFMLEALNNLRDKQEAIENSHRGSRAPRTYESDAVYHSDVMVEEGLDSEVDAQPVHVGQVQTRMTSRAQTHAGPGHAYYSEGVELPAYPQHPAVGRLKGYSTAPQRGEGNSPDVRSPASAQSSPGRRGGNISEV